MPPRCPAGGNPGSTGLHWQSETGEWTVDTLDTGQWTRETLWTHVWTALPLPGPSLTLLLQHRTLSLWIVDVITLHSKVGGLQTLIRSRASLRLKMGV